MHSLRRLLVTGLILMLSTVCGVFATENLVKNSSFEEGTGGMPSDWISNAYVKSPGITDFKWESDNAHSGNKYVTIINSADNDSKFKQDVSVKENAMYKISCWTKTKNVGTRNKGANISVEGKFETSPDVRGTNGKWENIAMYVKTGKGINSMKVIAGIGGIGSMNTGTASFDDVVVEEVDSIPGGVVAANLNIEKPVPASPPANNPVFRTGGPGKLFWFSVAGAVIVLICGAIFYKLQP
jgi:hypothetical protein